ncbi:MAG: IS110 family transposase [Candidatus Symbiothrix sp.]|jgi:transposase|nr:IS110 family transposase [Candidatus Symbiothrix sp.]
MEKIQKMGLLTGIPVINFHAAGIDVGSMLMTVSFTDTFGNQCLYETNGFTKDLKALVALLQEQGVKDVAMEATGVYWMSLYELLEDSGIKVTLINPSHYKNSANQKTDINDCIWIHQYHSCGILRHSHIAPDLYRELRHYIHERTVIQVQKSDTLNRMHRLLTLMNIKFQHLISDIEGAGGMKLLRAIACGITDPQELLSYINVDRFKAVREELLDSLNGIYKEQFVTLLQMKLEEYDFFVHRMKKYEVLIEGVLKKMPDFYSREEEAAVSAQKKKQGVKYVRKNQYGIDVKSHLKRITGIDLTQVEGFDEKMLLDIISVTGTDMSKWPTGQHFVSYLKLSPRKKISGGKQLGHDRSKTSNPATQAFRLAARSLAGSKGNWGVLYRRLSVKKGAKTANKAVARKLAVLFYVLVKNHQPYDKNKVIEQEQKRQEREIARFKKTAHRLGYTVQKVA